MIASGGWKTTRQGHYIDLEPQGRSMVAGGMYNLTPEQLLRFRQSISEDASEFKGILQTRDFSDTFGGDQR